MSRKFTLEEAISHQRKHGFGPISPIKYENHTDHSGLGTTVAQHVTAGALEQGPPREVCRMGTSEPRYRVEIALFRIKLLDRDNKWACVKALVDGLVAAGLIPGDAEGQINLDVRQEKVANRAAIKTVIEITEAQP